MIVADSTRREPTSALVRGQGLGCSDRAHRRACVGLVVAQWANRRYRPLDRIARLQSRDHQLGACAAGLLVVGSLQRMRGRQVRARRGCSSADGKRAGSVASLRFGQPSLRIGNALTSNGSCMGMLHLLLDAFRSASNEHSDWSARGVKCQYDRSMRSIIETEFHTRTWDSVDEALRHRNQRNRSAQRHCRSRFGVHGLNKSCQSWREDR